MTAGALHINASAPAVNAEKLALQLEQATDPADIRHVEAQIESIEHAMRQAGLYSTAEIRPVNELRMRARWKLGQALAKLERKQGARSDLTSSTDQTRFRGILAALKLDKMIALEAQRIGALPDGELERALTEAHKQDILCTFAALIHRARPYWYQASRERKHRTINANAAAQSLPDGLGPFPLILADPPWKWDHFGEADKENEKGKGRTPDQHYPTLTYAEIESFCIDGKPVSEIAHKDAALFLWCTSANIEKALKVLSAWHFTYKAHAVWVKDRQGTGLVFFNRHECLLYGTRGKMPGPQYQPSSVFEYPRGRHSAKPPEIRHAIEKMYPDFAAATRLELFARETVEGWSACGFESVHGVAS